MAGCCERLNECLGSVKARNFQTNRVITSLKGHSIQRSYLYSCMF